MTLNLYERLLNISLIDNFKVDNDDNVINFNRHKTLTFNNLDMNIFVTKTR